MQLNIECHFNNRKINYSYQVIHKNWLKIVFRYIIISYCQIKLSLLLLQKNVEKIKVLKYHLFAQKKTECIIKIMKAYIMQLWMLWQVSHFIKKCFFVLYSSKEDEKKNWNFAIHWKVNLLCNFIFRIFIKKKRITGMKILMKSSLGRCIRICVKN
jgi:hypothetical protein